MLSKNNFNERVRQMDEKKERFSIRKLTVGAASVLVGMTIFGMSNGQSVKADAQQDANDGHQAESQDVKAETAKSQSAQDVDQTKQDLQVKDLQDKVQNTDTSNSVELAKTNETLRNTDPKTAAALVNALSENKVQKNKSVTPSFESPKAENIDPKDKSEHTIDEEIEVNYTNSEGKTFFYSKKLQSGEMSYNSTTHKWNKFTFEPVSLENVLSGGFSESTTGKRNLTLPTIPGHHLELKFVRTSQDHDYTLVNDQLHSQLYSWAYYNHNPKALPKITVNYPVSIGFKYVYVADPVEVTDSADEEVHVYFPGNNNDDGIHGNGSGIANYRLTIHHQITGTKDSNGNITWNPTEISSQDLNDILNSHDFVDQSGDGKHGHSLPNFDGYIPVITHIETMNDSQYAAQSQKLHQELHNWVVNENDNTKLPSYKINVPVRTSIAIHFNKKVQDTEYETVHVYGPENDRDDANSEKHDGQSDYYATIEKQTINGIKDYEGKTTWDSGVNFGSHSLSDILKGNNFTKTSTGYRGFSLPEYKGYHAVITDAQVMGGPKEANYKLFAEVNGWIKAHPNATEIPAFASDGQLSIAFNIHFVKDAEPAQPTKPQTSTPDVQPTDPETPVTPDVPAQPTDAAQPTSAPVLPEKTPDENKSDDNDKQNETVRPHAAKAEKKAAGVAKAAPVKAQATKLAAKKAEAKAELPQTGEEKSEAGILGLAIAGLAGLLGIAADRKRN